MTAMILLHLNNINMYLIAVENSINTIEMKPTFKVTFN